MLVALYPLHDKLQNDGHHRGKKKEKKTQATAILYSWMQQGAHLETYTVLTTPYVQPIRASANRIVYLSRL